MKFHCIFALLLLAVLFILTYISSYYRWVFLHDSLELPATVPGSLQKDLIELLGLCETSDIQSNIIRLADAVSEVRFREALWPRQWATAAKRSVSRCHRVSEEFHMGR